MDKLDGVLAQRAIRRCFMPSIIIPDDGIEEEILRQCEIQSLVNQEVNEMYRDFVRTGELDFLSIVDNLGELGDDYLDAVYLNLLTHYGLYQQGYAD